MRQTGAGRPRFAAFLITLSIVFVVGLAQGQVPPLSPLPPGQVEAPGPPVGQVPESPPVGGQPQQTGPPAPPAAPAPAPPGAAPLDPFAGSPLLQMFGRQPNEPNLIREFRLAPVPEEPSPFAVRLSLTAEEEYTDNANQTKDNRISQISTILTPGISIRADRPWVNASLSYAPSVFIQNNSIGDTELNQSLSLRAALWPTARFQFNIADDFTDSTNFQDIQNPGSRRTGTSATLQNTAMGEAAYVLPRLRTALAYTNVINQDDLGTSTDTRISHLVRPNLLYTDPRVTVGGAYTLTRGDENSSIATPYWSHQGDGFFRYALSPAITPGVTGYYQFQEPDVGPHFSLGRGQATGTFSFGPGGTLDVGAGGDLFAQQGVSTQVSPSGFLAYTHRFSTFAVTARYQHGYVNNSLGVDGSGVTLTRSAGIFLTSGYFRNLTTTFGFRYDENQYEQTTTVAAEGTTDRTWAVDLLFRYLIVRSLFLTLGYSGTFRSSTQESAEFNENRVRLGLTYEYNPFW